MRNRRRNNNLIYCIILGVSLLAIIVVAGIYILKDLADKSKEDKYAESDSNQSWETDEPIDDTQSMTGVDVITGIPSESVSMPNDFKPVQTVQEYDINGDGESEKVQVTVDNGTAQASINVGGAGNLGVSLEPAGTWMQHKLTVVGISLRNEKRLAAIEYTYADAGMGLIKCHVWKYANNSFVKTSEIVYSGLIGNQGRMESGIIENRVPEDSFRHVAEENKNGYITERSIVIADMKDLGIKLPFETVGTYAITYDDNITFFYDMILQ